jgi:hypothetical protein
VGFRKTDVNSSMNIPVIAKKSHTNTKITTYLQDNPYFSIMYAKTRAALREIPAFPWIRVFPPFDKLSSTN